MYDIQVFEVKTLEALIDVFYFGVSAKKVKFLPVFIMCMHFLSFSAQFSTSSLVPLLFLTALLFKRSGDDAWNSHLTFFCCYCLVWKS